DRIMPAPDPYPPFSSSVPPPPWSALFPYTTLFRSLVLRLLIERQQAGGPLRAGRIRLFPAATRDADRERRYHLRSPGRTITSPEDRKSTRLNSSHVKISYAVFCLKKKTHQDTPQPN